jgi:hypothetical protein
MNRNDSESRTKLIGKTSISSQLIILVHLKIFLLVILVNTDPVHSNHCTLALSPETLDGLLR